MFSLLLLLAVYLPFQLALSPAEGIDAASIRIIIPLFFLGWLFESLRRRKFFWPTNVETLLVLFFIFLNVFSIFGARNTDWSLRKIFFWLSIFPIYFLVFGLCEKEEKAEKFLKALVWGGALAAIVGILQFFSQFILGLERVRDFWAAVVVVPFLGGSFSRAVLENSSWLVGVSGRTFFRAISVFPDPHMFSFFLGILAPVSLGIFLKNKKPLWLAFFALMFLADFLTFSRGGYVGILAGAIFLLIFFWSSLKFELKLILGTVSALVILALFSPGPVAERFFSSFDSHDGSNEGRLVMWQKSFEVSIEHPFLGVGIGNFPLEVKPSADYRDPIYAHNTYLDIAAETGWINAFFWITLLFFLTSGFLQKGKRNPVFLGVSAGLLVFATHSFFETGLYSPVILTLILSLAGLLNMKNEKEN